MFPIVMYLLCFSREVQTKLAVNVAFVPVVQNRSITGRKLSHAAVASVRRQVLQQTMEILLRQLQASCPLVLQLPIGVVVNATPLLMSIVADAAEAVLLASTRSNMKTNYPCWRCNLTNDLFHVMDTRIHLLKTVANMKGKYAEIECLRLKGERDELLQQYSLHIPKSILLSRFEASLDDLSLCTLVQSRIAGEPQSGSPARIDRRVFGCFALFGFSSFLKFESLHNFDLGLTADILQSIPNYFSVYMGPMIAARIVQEANRNQAGLPRISTTGMFRLSGLNTIIAREHPNCTAQNQFSAISVLPFMLRGSNKGISGSYKPMYFILKLALDYVRLHHFARRVNDVPWHVYSTLDDELKDLLQQFSRSYRNSIGKTKGRNAAQGPSENPLQQSTPKGHLLLCHLGRDVKAAGLLQNFSSEAGEKSHVELRAHYMSSTKQSDAEVQVYKRGTTREIGVLQALYPCNDLHGDHTVNSIRRKAQLGVRNLTEICEPLVDDLPVEEFSNMLKESHTSGDPGQYRRLLDKVRIVQSVRITAKFPWLDVEVPLLQQPSSVDGRNQTVRATADFHGEPQFDFVAYRQGTRMSFGQVRLLFEQPYADGLPMTGEYLALVREMEEVEVQDQAESCTSPQFWKNQCTQLLINSGCSYYRWATNGGKIRKRIIGINIVQRLVAMTVDFECPFRAEKGSKIWKERTAMDIEKDVKRLEEETRHVVHLAAEEPCMSYHASRPLRTVEDGPAQLTSYTEERFFHNKFLPWTKPGNR